MTLWKSSGLAREGENKEEQDYAAELEHLADRHNRAHYHLRGV